MSFQILSERLLIRPWETGDRAGLAQMTADPEMMRYISFGQPWTAAAVDEFLERQARHLANVGYCFGALCFRDQPGIIGMAGLQPMENGSAGEIGWWVWKEYWGRGLATEAGRAVIDFAFGEAGLSRLVAIADVPNLASIRVMQKLGMRYERRTNARELAARHPDVEVELYALEREGE